MSTNPVVKDLKQKGKEQKREGWQVESAGQVEKWAGAVIGDEVKEEKGREKQLEGNAMKHEGKALQHMAGVEDEMDKAANPQE